MKRFSTQTIQKLNFYVYILTYGKGSDETIFYVGKGKANRVFEHFNIRDKINLDSFSNIYLTEKQKIIVNSKCNAYIVEANLSSKEALKIEALLINLLSTFPNAFITNIKNGHHKFDINHVNEIEFKYSKPIDLEVFCTQNKIKTLTLKSNTTSYINCLKKDFRGTLEGIWSLDKDKLEQTDYVLGIHEGSIYGVYKYIKGSLKSLSEFTQDSWDRWNQIHLAMGRQEKYALINDVSLSSLDKKKVVFELKPILVPESQFIKFNSSISERDKMISKKLINRKISNKKILGRSGRYYFGFN